jgi:methyl-accepting chemotaxis protein
VSSLSYVLSPAIRLANSIPFFQKLILIILSFLLPCGFLLVKDISRQQSQINKNEHQIIGVNLAISLKTLMLDTAKHRGNMAQYLTGDTTKRTVLLSIEHDVENSMKYLSHQLSDTELDDSFVESFNRQWLPLKVDNIKLDGKNSFTEHTQLITLLDKGLHNVISHHEVELQDDAIEYYLAQICLYDIPSIQELIGQLRGKGAGALADKLLTKEESAQAERLLSGIISELSRYEMSMQYLSSKSAIWQELAGYDSAFKKKLETFNELTRKIINSPDQVSISSTEFFTEGTSAIEEIGKLDKFAVNHLIEKSTKLLDEAVQVRNTELLIAMLVLILGCYFAAGVVVAMNSSVKELNVSTEKLKSGDFTHPPKSDSNDLIGEVSDHLSQVIANVSALLLQIKNSATQVNQLAKALQQSTSTVKNELDQQNNQTIQAASASTQMAATVREVARNCVEASNATESTREKALQGELKVKDAISQINRLGNDVGIAQQNISQLQEDVSSISTVLEVIRSIAEQTNLLALNAAIEAARAGEQGRGFAVVADEVRSLAKRTQDSTAEIKSVIEKLQQRAKNAVSIINQSFAGAQASVVSAAEAGDQLHDIVQGVELMSDYNTQIASAAEEQAATAEQMSRNTRQLSESADEILRQVVKTQTFAEELETNANLLNSNILKFKI